MTGRYLIFCCGSKSKKRPNICFHSGEKKDICMDCCTKQTKQWYLYGYEDAKKGKSKQYKKWKKEAKNEGYA
jgi:hypothetical protein